MMTSLLPIALKIAGTGLIVLFVVQFPLAKRLRWKDDAKRMSPENESIFRVYSIFIKLIILIQGVVLLVATDALMEKSRLGAWCAGGFSLFWIVRLYCQFLVYPEKLWKGKPIETRLHVFFTIVWILLSGTGVALLYHQLT